MLRRIHRCPTMTHYFYPSYHSLPPLLFNFVWWFNVLFDAPTPFESVWCFGLLPLLRPPRSSLADYLSSLLNKSKTSPKLLHYIIVTGQPQPQPKSISTRVGIDKVIRWTTHPTNPHHTNPLKLLRHFQTTCNLILTQLDEIRKTTSILWKWKTTFFFFKWKMTSILL